MILKSVKNIPVIAVFLFMLFPISVFTQTQEADAYKQAESLQDKQQKIDAFNNFISTYPGSQYKANALMELFSIYVDNNEIKTALNYADQAVQSVPDQLKMNMYNEIAYSLAQKKIGLDTAAIYIQRAVSEAWKTNSKYRWMFLDTQALVMYDLGKADSALALEKEVLKVYNDDPSILSSLATYQEAAGYRIEGLKTAANAILLGNTDEALTNFDKWIEKEKPDKKGQDKLRKTIADSTLRLFFEKSKKEDKYAVNSNAAAFLASVRVNLKQADKWVKEAIASLNDNSAINDRILYTKNYGLVLFAEGKYKDALKVLNPIETLADPWDTNFWYALGKTYEKANENKKALDSYVTGSIAIRPLSLENALKELGVKEGISKNRIDSLIAQKRREYSSVEPGHYNGKSSKGNVVLAELFTGAECGPCASADYAFEVLSDYYTRNEVAILEYHLHIPGPDPMTNPDSFGRYQYYGSNFGTPTAFFQGKSMITGGGPKFITKNRFNVYKYTLDKYLTKDYNVKLTGTVKQANDSISVSLQINKEKPIANNTSIHIALVEKSIKYQAGNGVTNHIFVVRSVAKGANGVPIEAKKGNETASEVFNISEIDKGLSKYLDDPTKDPSWRANLPSVEWKARPDKLDKKNLAVVAWIQNNKTKEILQSIYLDVPADNL